RVDDRLRPTGGWQSRPVLGRRMSSSEARRTARVFVCAAGSFVLQEGAGPCYSIKSSLATGRAVGAGAGSRRPDRRYMRVRKIHAVVAVSVALVLVARSIERRRRAQDGFSAEPVGDI